MSTPNASINKIKGIAEKILSAYPLMKVVLEVICNRVHMGTNFTIIKIANIPFSNSILCEKISKNQSPISA